MRGPLSALATFAVGLAAAARQLDAAGAAPVAFASVASLLAYVGCGLSRSRLPLRTYLALLYAPRFVVWKTRPDFAQREPTRDKLQLAGIATANRAPPAGPGSTQA